MYENNASGFGSTISHLINAETPSKEASVLTRIDAIIKAFENMGNK